MAGLENFWNRPISELAEEVAKDATKLPEAHPPLVGTELVEGAMTLGDEHFGKNLIDKIRSEHIDLVVIIGEAGIGKTTHAKQIRAGLKQVAPRSDPKIYTQDQAISQTKREIKRQYPELPDWIIDDTALWEYYIPNAWQRINEKLTAFALPQEYPASNWNTYRIGKSPELRILELTAVGKPDKGHTTLHNIAAYIQDNSIPRHQKLTILVLGMVSDPAIKRQAIELRESVPTWQPYEVIDRLGRHPYYIKMRGFPISATNKIKKGVLTMEMFRNKSREHRVMAYEHESEEDRITNGDKFTKVAHLIPTKARQIITIPPDEFDSRVNQMHDILRRRFGIDEAHGVLYINPLHKGFRVEFYESDILPLTT